MTGDRDGPRRGEAHPAARDSLWSNAGSPQARVDRRFLLLSSLFLLESSFRGVVPGAVGGPAFGLAALLVVLTALRTLDLRRVRIEAPAAFWLVLGAYALAGRTSESVDFFPAAALFISTILVVVASQSASWCAGMLVALVTYGLVHALATLLLYVAPATEAFLVWNPGEARLTSEQPYRFGITMNPGVNAVYIAVGLIVLGVVFMFARHVRRSWVQWLFLGMLFLSLLLTAKRAHLVFALLAVFVTFTLVQRRGRWTRAALLVLGGWALLSVLSTVSEGVAVSLSRLTGTFEADSLEDATNGRIALWNHALAGWRDAPFFGHGWGSYAYTSPSGTTFVIAHNQLLNLLYEGGIAGVVLFVVAAVASLAAALKGLRSRGSARVFASVSVALQVFFLAYSMTTGELLSKSYTFVPYLVAVAMGIAADRQRKSQSALAPMGEGRATA